MDPPLPSQRVNESCSRTQPGVRNQNHSNQSNALPQHFPSQCSKCTVESVQCSTTAFPQSVLKVYCRISPMLYHSISPVSAQSVLSNQSNALPQHFPSQCSKCTVNSYGPEVIKLFSCSAQLSWKFKVLINTEIAKINQHFRFRSPNPVIYPAYKC